MPEQYIDSHSLTLIREKLWNTATQKKITLEDIQDRTGFSYSQVYRIVRGKNNISVSVLLGVCKALEIQPAELFNFKLLLPKYPPLRKDRKKGKNQS
ncbi:MAG: XRE family transcriptional regulator [Sphingobacteriales bacterium]|nr:MAG: XRE family transcriptional regulator [Sphingobacteriales bacterium]